MTTNTYEGDVRSTIESLHSVLGDRAVVTSGPRYEAACAVWNAAVRARPAIVVVCRSTNDVRVAVDHAREARIPLSVRGGGYDWAGRSLKDRGLVVDLSEMREVSVEGNVAIVAGGTTISDVLDAAETHGMSAATGTVGAVGMAGLTLGGGYGRLSGIAGLAADNLLGATVVLADGSVVVTDVDHEPDLLWALRGAGGNFGVVTEMRIRLHPVPNVITGLITFSRDGAERVLARLRSLMEQAPDEFTPIFGLMAGPEGPLLYVSPGWTGDTEIGERFMDRIRSLGEPVMDQVSTMPVAASVHLVDEQFGPGRFAAIRTRSVPELSDPVIAALLEAADRFPSAGCAVNLHHLHGAATRPSPDATAFSLRRDHFTVEILPSWESGSGTAELIWADDLARSLDQYSFAGGYANLLGPDDAERAAMSYGDNAARVLEVKDRYDPMDMFTALTLPSRTTLDRS